MAINKIQSEIRNISVAKSSKFLILRNKYEYFRENQIYDYYFQN